MPNVDYDAALTEFDSKFVTEFEDAAAQARGAFLRAFPMTRLRTLTVDEYVIGMDRPTFCTFVEPKTRLWANILGATAIKFGIYFGRTKSDPTRRYRYKAKYKSKAEAFRAVRDNLLKLLDDGRALRFEAVDDNELSQMFKAKILSLYFPDLFLNVCSGDHIEALASELGISTDGPVSEQQHLLLQAKLDNPRTRTWSNPKFMTFLYNTYIRKSGEAQYVQLGASKSPPPVDMEELLERWKKIGEKSEHFALEWEKERLIGLNYSSLVGKIEDWRTRPSCGYDFLSHSAPNVQRFIEVKTAGRNRAGHGHRFFLSETQHTVSNTPASKNQYFFYLVFYNEDGEPSGLKVRKAADLYATSEKGPNGYVVTFDWGEDPEQTG